MTTTTEKPRRIRAHVVRFGQEGKIDNDLPKCVDCGRPVRFGYLLQVAPAAFQGEGVAEVLTCGKHWACWVYCRECRDGLD